MSADYDLAIIGGGITGLGVARAAADEGKSVILLERGELCGAASSASLRIIHGGFRYLQQCDVQRIIESVRAQIRLVAEYPEFIKPLQCYMPLQKAGLKSKYPVSAAAFLYRAIYRMLSGKEQSLRARVVSGDAVESEVPLLTGKCSYGALSWQDAYIEDFSGLVETLEKELREKGVEVCERSNVQNVTYADGYYSLQTSTDLYRSKQVVNATGAQIGDEAFATGPSVADTRWAKGFNIIVNKKLLESGRAVGIQSDAGRLFFLCPRDEGTAIGTWYVPVKEVVKKPEVVGSEIEAALREIAELFPDVDLSSRDVDYTEAGFLPMSGVQNGEPQLVRKERVFADQLFATVLSTKFTTFQLLGQKTLLQVSKKK